MTQLPTLTQGDLSLSGNSSSTPEVSALVVIWCPDEPEHVGEVMLPTAGDPGPIQLFGRGSYHSDAGPSRLRLFRQRPGMLEPANPVHSPHLSREQLHIQALANGALAIRRVGRLRMLHDGKDVDALELKPGDVLELRNLMLLLCVRRPILLAAPPGLEGCPPHPFGGPDAFGMVGESPPVWELRQQTGFIAGRGGHVLILGESGTGKELVARAIHSGSSRGGRTLVARNAATFPESLIDAELFGNLKNYPNPGMPERPGLIGEADGSTLFLDEIGELPVSLQAHLLRVLDRGEYQRLGESTLRRSDFRLVAATNRAPEALKHDLLARLGWRLTIPDLNERREDIPLLARHLLLSMAARDPGIARFFREVPQPDPRLTPALMRALVRHRYTTHIRELQALLMQAMSHSTGTHIDLHPELPIEEAPLALEDASEVDPDAIPREAIQASLDRHRGVQARVWRELGLKSRFVLHRLIRKHGLEVRSGEGGEG